MIDCFQINSAEVFSVAHLLNKEFIIQLKQLNDEIKSNILSAKQGLPIKDEDGKRILEQISQFDRKMRDEIDKKLSEIEQNINILLK